MAANGLRIPHAHRRPLISQPSYRCDFLGELIQIDGSHYDWFKDVPPGAALAYIADATGCLMHRRFCQSEPASDYKLATREYVDKHGKLVAVYCDKQRCLKSARRACQSRKDDLTALFSSITDCAAAPGSFLGFYGGTAEISGPLFLVIFRHLKDSVSNGLSQPFHPF